MNEHPYDRCYTCGYRRDEHLSENLAGMANHPGCDLFRLAVTVPADTLTALHLETFTLSGTLNPLVVH